GRRRGAGGRGAGDACAAESTPTRRPRSMVGGSASRLLLADCHTTSVHTTGLPLLMGTSRSIRPVPYLVALTVLAAADAASARPPPSIPRIAAQVTLVWPPTGIALASLFLLGRALWPGVAVGAFIANYFASEPITAAVGIAIGNTLEALVGVWLLERAG